MGKIIKAADLFCGAGGSSSGLIKAVHEMRADIELLAINHWDVAIATHSKNHGKARHLCQSLDSVNPLDLIQGRRLDILIASPECTDHSNAKGGKPRSDQKRADAWLLLRWIEELYVENILIENVKEFRDWGPLNSKGKPDKRYRGLYFKQFIETLKVNYNIEWRILNAADFGDATTRERLFIIARRPKHKPITWPRPTHAKKEMKLSGGKTLKRWRAAHEIIDWDLEGESIFNRKRPLSPNTLKRIFAGLFKYSLKPFLVGAGGQVGQGAPRSVDDPMRTILTDDHQALVQPFLLNLKGDERRDRSVDSPTFTQTSGGNHQYLVQPFLVQHFGERNGQRPRTRSIDDPLWTVTAQGRMAIVEPFIVPCNHGKGDVRSHSVNEPMPTITSIDAWAVIEPFLIKYFTGSDACSVDAPLPTVTANYEHLALVQPYLIGYHGNHNGREDGARRTRSLDEPLPTQDTSNRYALIQPYLIKFNGTGGARSVDDPLDTITGKDRFGLVIPQIGAVLDIRFRMLQPHELAAAMSFPKSYIFTGNREEKVRQIGNAVAVRTAKALCKAILAA